MTSKWSHDQKNKIIFNPNFKADLPKIKKRIKLWKYNYIICICSLSLSYKIIIVSSEQINVIKHT